MTSAHAKAIQARRDLDRAVVRIGEALSEVVRPGDERLFALVKLDRALTDAECEIDAIRKAYDR